MKIGKENNVRPLNDLIMVELLKETKTVAGIVLPEAHAIKRLEAKVLAVGPGKRDAAGKRIPVDVEVGQHIMVRNMCGVPMTLDGMDVVFIKENDIVGVIE